MENTDDWWPRFPFCLGQHSELVCVLAANGSQLPPSGSFLVLETSTTPKPPGVENQVSKNHPLPSFPGG